MLPELCLAMFMETYSLTRTEATKRMQLQEKISQANYQMDETLDDESTAVAVSAVKSSGKGGIGRGGCGRQMKQ